MRALAPADGVNFAMKNWLSLNDNGVGCKDPGVVWKWGEVVLTGGGVGRMVAPSGATG